MGNINLMHAKLHRVRVTDSQLSYVGSITIDKHLLEKVGILPLEEVNIVNLNNGKRWSTYVLPGTPGQICPNGGGAILCDINDILVIWANISRDRKEVYLTGHQAKIIVADSQNNCLEYFEQTLISDNGHLTFNCEHNSENYKCSAPFNTLNKC